MRQTLSSLLSRGGDRSTDLDRLILNRIEPTDSIAIIGLAFGNSQEENYPPDDFVIESGNY